MAKAKRIKQTITERRKVDRVQLTLTEGEADFILGLMGRIGGDPVASPRKYQQRVKDALEAALGYHYSETDSAKLVREGNIFFKDYPEPRYPEPELWEFTLGRGA